MRHIAPGALAAIFTLAALPAVAQDPASFYAGKTVRIVIGFETAGTYGQYALMAARHLRKHLPGNPGIIVQAMPGAGGSSALNYVAKVAAKDGLTIVMPPINMVQDGLLSPKIDYDPSRFHWLGRMMELVQIGVANEKSGIAKLEDGLKRDPSLQGRIAVRFVIGTDGKVVSAVLATGDDGSSADAAPAGTSATPPLTDGAVTTCVIGVFKQLVFPPPDGGTLSVLYPIAFGSTP